MVAALAPAERQYDSDVFSSWEEEQQFFCSESFLYFVVEYCYIYDSVSKDWIKFALWPAQMGVARHLPVHKMIAVLKARQLGLTWLALCYALWLMLFRPIAQILIFNKREEEANYLLSADRLRGIYDHLPEFLQAEWEDRSNVKLWRLSNGSTARAFPTTAGDSYTGTLAIVDEADFVDNLGRLLRAVKPTVEAGGQLLLISTANKAKPNSAFKSIMRSALDNLNEYLGIFLPWDAHPERDAHWYEAQKQTYLSESGGTDELKANYPSTPEEAMDPSETDKRIPADWLNACIDLTVDTIDVLPPEIMVIPGLRVFHMPHRHDRFAGGSDCAEGLPTSDDSVTTFIDVKTGRQVCVLTGKFTPAVHAAYTMQIARWLNNASVMVENNNHGHAFIQYMENNGGADLLLEGHNNKVGWTSSTLGKVIMYDGMAETAKNAETTIHDRTTADQLKSINKGTLRAPEGDMEDHADAYALAIQARLQAVQIEVVPHRFGRARR